MTDSSFWLAIGAFVVSPGFGALAAVFAAFLAYVGIGRQLRGERRLAEEKAQEDRESALEGDRRRRWWTVLTWLWGNRDALGDHAMLEGLIALKSTQLTVEQATMLQLVTEATMLKKAEPTQGVPGTGEPSPAGSPAIADPDSALAATRRRASHLITELEEMKGTLPHGI